MTYVLRGRSLSPIVLLAWAVLGGTAQAEPEVAGPTLMDGFSRAGAGPALERSRIRVHGWVEASVGTTPTTRAELRDARVFDNHAEAFRLHQTGLVVERALTDECCFDVGGKAFVLWGTDARLLHSVGLLDDQGGDEQWDVVEAYASAKIPVGRGLTVKAGKIATPMGFEVIDAPSNLLPSRSFLYGFAIPFTHVGVMATLDASDQWKVSYGAFRGWDIFDDTNDAWSHHVGAAWTSPLGGDTVTLQAVVGPERAGNDRDLRAVVDFIWTFEWSDTVRTAVNADVGFEEDAAPDGGDATWWGVATYLTKDFTDCLSATARAEYFRDADGTRLGQEASLGGLTVGLDWRPIACAPNVHVRPEVRWDHSFDGRFFDGGADRDQVSIALEVVATF